jgi:peptidoglycan/xylan/chitin deacetylase (PgdA/CDA1 family)
VSWLRASAAAAVLSFDVDAESPILNRGRRYADNPGVMSHQAYGPLVGVPRILALLEEYRIRATFFVPGLTADRYPDVVERIAAAGHEVGHHSYAHKKPVGMSEPEERADFERALVTLERLGVRPQGYRAPGWEPAWRTPALVAEYGLVYDSSLMDDDRPYVLETGAGAIVELPVHWSLDDWEQYAYVPEPDVGGVIEAPSKVLELWRGELDAMRRYGCLFVLTMHPFLSGRPARVEALRALIEHAVGCGDVEFVAGAEVAKRVLADPDAPRRPLRPVEIEPGLYPE